MMRFFSQIAFFIMVMVLAVPEGHVAELPGSNKTHEDIIYESILAKRFRTVIDDLLYSLRFYAGEKIDDGEKHSYYAGVAFMKWEGSSICADECNPASGKLFMIYEVSEGFLSITYPIENDNHHTVVFVLSVTGELVEMSQNALLFKRE